MIQATFNICEGMDKGDFDKCFENEDKMWEWYRTQIGHPFLSIELTEYKEVEDRIVI